jgi:integrase
MGSQPGLLAVAREKMRTRHLALRTEHAYLQWLRRYIGFHNRRHPRELGAPEVEQFLTHLAVHRKVSAATQSPALQALLFLYRHLLYGSGLRLMEGLRLRVKDLALERGELIVREAKGGRTASRCCRRRWTPRYARI